MLALLDSKSSSPFANLPETPLPHQVHLLLLQIGHVRRPEHVQLAAFVQALQVLRTTRIHRLRLCSFSLDWTLVFDYLLERLEALPQSFGEVGLIPQVVVEFESPVFVFHDYLVSRGG